MKITNKRIVCMVDIQDAATGGVCLPNQAYALARGNTLDILCNVLIYSIVRGSDRNNTPVWASLCEWHTDTDIMAGRLAASTIAGDGCGKAAPAGLTSVPMYDLNSGMFRMGRAGDRYSATRHSVSLLKLFQAASNAREASTITTVKAWEAVIPKMYIIPKGGGGNMPKHIPGIGQRDMVEVQVPMLLSPWKRAIGDALGLENEYDEFEMESRYSRIMLDVMNSSEDGTIYISHPGGVVPNVAVNLDDFVPAGTYNTLVSNGKSLRVRSEMSITDFHDPFSAFDCSNRDKLATLLSTGELTSESAFTI